MSKLYKVLFVLPNFGQNGAVDFIVDLADAMTLQDCDVEILALQGSRRKSRRPNDRVTVTTTSGDQPAQPGEATPLRRVRRRLKLLFMFYHVFRSVLRSNVVILTWEKGLALLLPSLAAYILHKPTVAVVQNNLQRSLRDYSNFDWLRVLRWAYRRARAVICISNDQISILESIGIRGNKLVVIPNAVNVERVRALSKHAPPTILPANPVPFIIGVGRLAPQKGFDFLIRAHAKVLQNGTEHRLALVGDGPDKEALMTLAEECGVSDSVLFLGFLSNPYPTFVRSALFCLSSRYEGRPLALSDAALLGVPIVAANCLTGPREILAGGLYGDLVESESVEALSTAIEKHLRDPRRLSAKALASARDSDRLSIRTCAQRYIGLFGQHVC